jgi:hypothetical protein
MNKQHKILTTISLIVISGVIGISACTTNPSAVPGGDIEAQVNTAVAATLMQRMIETKVAAESIAMVTGPAVQVQATEPPTSTPTPVPTEAAQPTAAATVEVAQPTPTAPPTPDSSPKIIADQNTNCRVGPSTGYAVKTYFVQGSESTVEGMDKGKDWWYIINPNDSSGFCWVWDGSTTVQGDTSTLPVIAAPTGVEPKSSDLYYVWNVYNPKSCVNYYTSCCGKTECCNKYVGCKPNYKKCNPYYWGTCKPYVNCTCKPVYQDPCKKSGCPAVTEVNYKNYCKKYPQCCDEDGL